jgi:hypothetical protein
MVREEDFTQEILEKAEERLNAFPVLKTYLGGEVIDDLKRMGLKGSEEDIETLQDYLEDKREEIEEMEIYDTYEAIKYFEKYDKSMQEALDIAKERGWFDKEITINELATIYAQEKMFEELDDLAQNVMLKAKERGIDFLKDKEDLEKIVKEEFERPNEYTHLKDYFDEEDFKEAIEETIKQLQKEAENEKEINLAVEFRDIFFNEMYDRVKEIEFYYPDEAFNYLKTKTEENPKIWENAFDTALSYLPIYDYGKPIHIETLATFDLRERLNNELSEFITEIQDYIENKLNQDLTQKQKLSREETIKISPKKPKL